MHFYTLLHACLLQMGIHEEELLWLAERVKHLKGTVLARVLSEPRYSLESEPAGGGFTMSKASSNKQQTGKWGEDFSTDAESEYDPREGYTSSSKCD